jgi:uncharacterized membrane protein YuzA (DUF378 family)
MGKVSKAIISLLGLSFVIGIPLIAYLVSPSQTSTVLYILIGFCPLVIIIFGIYNFEKIYKKLCCKASNDNVNQIDSVENEVFLPPDTMEMTPQSGAKINSA